MLSWLANQSHLVFNQSHSYFYKRDEDYARIFIGCTSVSLSHNCQIQLKKSRQVSNISLNYNRLVPLISKWSVKVLHREISNRFNVAPHLTFLDFQSYIIISTMSTIYEVIYSQNWSLILFQWFFWSQCFSLWCKVLPQHRNQRTVSVTKINCVLRIEG